MKKELFYDGISLQNQRPTNMDAIFMQLREIRGENVGLFLVADGVGSTESGGEASQFMVDELGEWFSDQVSLRHLGQSMSQVIFSLNQELLEKLGEKSGATTLSALLVGKKQLSFCHVGDSRIYQSGAELATPWTQLSCDHANEEGKLLDYLGKRVHFRLDFWEKPRKPGRFLLCTDGFYRRQDWANTALLLGSATAESIRNNLEELSLDVMQKGENDNCSALLVVMD